MTKKLPTLVFCLLIAIGFAVGCGPSPTIPPPSEGSTRDYDAKGGYINEEGTWKGDWGIGHGLFDTGGNPVTSGTLKFYIKNYEDRLGRFTVRINFWDKNDSFVEAFDYKTISVGPGETEYGYISYNYLWENKPGRARYFNVQLDVPQYRRR